MATAALNEPAPAIPATPVAIPTAELPQLYADVPKPKMLAVKLLANYRPMKTLAEGGYEIVGHTRPAILKKNAAGVLETVQDEAFIADEAAPPPPNGTLSPTKLWAGTIIRLPVAEAKAIKKAGVAEYEIDDAD